MQRKTLALLLLLTMVWSSNASAQETTETAWEFTLTPYAWLAGQSGSVATLPGLPAAEIDIDFWDDIVGNLNGALFVIGEARKDRLGGFFNLAYVDIEDDSAITGQAQARVVSKTKSWMADGAGLYRFAETDGGSADVFAGMRYWAVESSLELSGLFGVASAENTKSWIDPLIGVKGKKSLGGKFFVSGFAVAGGFGAGSDLFWDINVNLGYTWTDSISTSIGYRYLDVKYDKSDFLYDISQQGPTLAFSWRF